MMSINAPGIPGQQLKRKSEVNITFVPDNAQEGRCEQMNLLLQPQKTWALGHHNMPWHVSISHFLSTSFLIIKYDAQKPHSDLSKAEWRGKTRLYQALWRSGGFSIDIGLCAAFSLFSAQSTSADPLAWHRPKLAPIEIH